MSIINVTSENFTSYLGKADVPKSHLGDVSVEWLIAHASNGTLETGAREYQREKVAPLLWKQNLLNTVLADTVARIPQIHIRVKSNSDGTFNFEIIDGQQRVTTLIDFLQNKFALARGQRTAENTLVGNMNMREVERHYPQIIHRIKQYRITTTWYENIDDAQTARLFVEVLNNTNDMKPQEIRNAIRGLLSEYIRNRSRFENQHELFSRKVTGHGTAREKITLEHLPRLALKGRMEVDEWLSQLIYLNEHGAINGVSNKALTDWITNIQRPGNKAAIGSEKRFREIEKRSDDLLDFAFKLVDSVDHKYKNHLSPMMAMMMILYGAELQKSNLKVVDPKAYTDMYFDIITRWSDTKTKLYINHKMADKKSQMPPMKELFGGKNSKAIGTIFYILDLERDKNPNKFGLLLMDPRETFSEYDIIKKWKEQDGKCFYTGRPLNEDEIVGDHYIPRSWGIDKGGVTEYSNLVVTDSRTNIRKGKMDGDTFVNLLKNDKETA